MNGLNTIDAVICNCLCTKKDETNRLHLFLYLNLSIKKFLLNPVSY